MDGDRRIDLAAIDAILDRLGAADEDGDDGPGPPPTPADVDHGVSDGASGRHDATRRAPLSGRSAVPETDPLDGWGSGTAAAVNAPHDGRRGRTTAGRRARSGPGRPGDLPPLHAPSGYRRDGRGTWRYTGSGMVVPGARDVTIRSLWPLPVSGRAVLVAVDEVAAAAELAWCATVGDPVTTTREGASVAGWAVPVEEWEDRADWVLTVSAPELSPSRLVGVDEAARLFGVASSTVTADLTRGRFPQPQLRVGGRPAWSLPILLAALRSRPGRW